MLDVEVIPGKSVGEFKIGMPISSAIAHIQKNYKTISAVELKYCEEDLLNTYLLIDLNEEGLLLRFEPRTQRLHSIEVYDLTRVVLRYCGVAFSGPDTLPTFVLIYGRFGPSFPGEYNRDRQTYCLDYPGVTFTFPIPNKWKHFDEAELPIEFSDGTTPTAARMVVYHGEKRDTTIPPLDLKEDYFEELRVHAAHGIKFMRRGCRLDFQSTAQDVLTELGRPDRTFYKHEDKMRIHSGDQAIIGAGCEDYFYNYFKLGLDILFDMRTHVVKKFILHTNFPCHNDFNIYNKCNFKLFFGSPEEIETTSESEGTETEDKSGSEDRAQLDELEPEERPKMPALADDEDDDGEGDEEEEEAAAAHAAAAAAAANGSNGRKKNRNRRKKGKGKATGPAALHNEDEDEEPEEEHAHVGHRRREEEDEDEEPLVKKGSSNKMANKSNGGNSNNDKKMVAKKKNGNTAAAVTVEEKGKRKVKETESPRPIKVDKEEKPVVKLNYIHPDMKWEEVQQVLPGAPSKPVVNTTTSPFGSTLFYGHNDLIFEVMRNGHVASICIFSTPA